MTYVGRGRLLRFTPLLIFLVSLVLASIYLMPRMASEPQLVMSKTFQGAIGWLLAVVVGLSALAFTIASTLDSTEFPTVKRLARRAGANLTLSAIPLVPALGYVFTLSAQGNSSISKVSLIYIVGAFVYSLLGGIFGLSDLTRAAWNIMAVDSEALNRGSTVDVQEPTSAPTHD